MGRSRSSARPLRTSTPTALLARHDPSGVLSGSVTTDFHRLAPVATHLGGSDAGWCLDARTERSTGPTEKVYMRPDPCSAHIMVARTPRYAASKPQLTADDIWATPDDGTRYEIIDGELYGSPPPVTEHQDASGALFAPIYTFVQQHHLGKVWTAPIGVKLDSAPVAEPDLVYVSQDRLRKVSTRGIEGAPDLVVETLSPSTRRVDLDVKRRRYQAPGIRTTGWSTPDGEISPPTAWSMAPTRWPAPSVPALPSAPTCSRPQYPDRRPLRLAPRPVSIRLAAPPVPRPASPARRPVPAG